MNGRYEIYSGARVGRWTVLEKSASEAERWKCRCACGTERDVSERGLKYSETLSCGCLRRDQAAKKTAHDLTGQRFGSLTVIERTESRDSRRGRWWKCRCDCGKELAVLGTLLKTGKKTSCGCATVKKYVFADITGQKFHRLTALYRLDKRTPGGSVIWHCRCECGNELDVSYNELMYTNIKSCGCQKKEHDQKLKDLLPHVDGTSISHLRSTRTPVNNTTGTKGVYLIRGKYVAKIVFQKKQYYLGAYDDISDAVMARKTAEEELNGSVTEFYDYWKKAADAFPEWGKANPMKINVDRVDGQFRVNLLPRLRDFPAAAQ